MFNFESFLFFLCSLFFWDCLEGGGGCWGGGLIHRSVCICEIVGACVGMCVCEHLRVYMEVVTWAAQGSQHVIRQV